MWSVERIFSANGWALGGGRVCSVDSYWRDDASCVAFDILFSEEMFNAMKYGYTFQVHCGYLFDRANLFEQFINELYQLRLSYAKSDPMNLICKLVMNSCYGKFGQAIKLPIYMILNENDHNENTLNNKIHDIAIERIVEDIDLNNGNI